MRERGLSVIFDTFKGTLKEEKMESNHFICDVMLWFGGCWEREKEEGWGGGSLFAQGQGFEMKTSVYGGI